MREQIRSQVSNACIAGKAGEQAWPSLCQSWRAGFFGTSDSAVAQSSSIRSSTHIPSCRQTVPSLWPFVSALPELRAVWRCACKLFVPSIRVGVGWQTWGLESDGVGRFAYGAWVIVSYCLWQDSEGWAPGTARFTALASSQLLKSAALNACFVAKLYGSSIGQPVAYIWKQALV